MISSCCRRLSKEEEKERKKRLKYEQKKSDKIQCKSLTFTVYLTRYSVRVLHLQST